MTTEQNHKKTLKLISNKLIKNKVIGFNVEKIKGFWNSKSENTFKISFINTFGIKTKDLINILEQLKTELKQESILIEQEKVLYDFV